MNLINNFLWALLALLSIAVSAFGQEVAAPKPEGVIEYQPYAAGNFSVSPFTGWNVSKFDELAGRQFAGLGVEYMVVERIGIAAEAALSDTDERFIDQYGVHFRGYLPLVRKLAAYGELGWLRFTRDGDDKDTMSAGAGLTVRGKRLGVSVGGRWVHDFREVGNAQFLVSGHWNF